MILPRMKYAEGIMMLVNPQKAKAKVDMAVVTLWKCIIQHLNCKLEMHILEVMRKQICRGPMRTSPQQQLAASLDYG